MMPLVCFFCLISVMTRSVIAGERPVKGSSRRQKGAGMFSISNTSKSRRRPPESSVVVSDKSSRSSGKFWNMVVGSMLYNVKIFFNVMPVGMKGSCGRYTILRLVNAGDFINSPSMRMDLTSHGSEPKTILARCFCRCRFVRGGR